MTLPPAPGSNVEAARAVLRESLYHEARVLLLIDAFGGESGPLVGLTKLVKLDFLLRYPLMASRMLPIGVTWPDGLEPSEDEMVAVESRMIRYKYGPWDDRYYPLLGALVGKHLADFIGREGGGFAIDCTSEGREIANRLAAEPSWTVVAQRAQFLRLHFDLPGQVLKGLVYSNLPDVAALPMRSEI